MLYAATLRRQQANVVQRGLFTFRGLPARSYFLVALDAVQEGRWYDPGFLEGLKERATRLALADAEAKPVDLVANGTSELKAVVGEVVLTIATLTGDWTLESVAFNGRDVARPDQHGEFSIKELPAGHYLIAAVDYVQDGQSYDPEFLAYLRPRAQRLSLAEAESKRIDVIVGKEAFRTRSICSYRAPTAPRPPGVVRQPPSTHSANCFDVTADSPQPTGRSGAQLLVLPGQGDESRVTPSRAASVAVPEGGVARGAFLWHLA